MPANKLEIQIGGDARGLKKELGDTKGALEGFRKNASRVFEASRGGLAKFAAGGAAAAATIVSVGSALALLKKGMDGAINAEKTRVAFEVLTGSATKAKAVLADISKFAAETPFELPELEEAGKKLLSFGIGTKDLVADMRMLGDVASALGIPLGELADIYGKLKVQGRVFGEDINQIQGRGINITAALAKQFGVAESAVKGMVEEGRVGFDNVRYALQQMTGAGGQFFQMMERQSGTLGGKLSTLSDSVNMALTKFSEPIRDELKPIVDSLTRTMETGGSKAVKWGEQAAQLVRRAAPFIEKLPEYLEKA
jgi:tape measure domain-containing protein